MRLSLVIVALGTAAPVLPAQADSLVMTDQVSAGGSYVYLLQRGNANAATLDQINGAVAAISQTGDGNTVRLQQAAGDSVTSTQTGNGLTYTMEQSANAGHVTIIQHR